MKTTTKHGIVKNGVAFLVAAAVNLIIFFSALTTFAPSVTPHEVQHDYVQLTLTKERDSSESKSDKPDELIPEQELMTVDLDLPLPKPIEIEQIKLDISMPRVSEVHPIFPISFKCDNPSEKQPVITQPVSSVNSVRQASKGFSHPQSSVHINEPSGKLSTQERTDRVDEPPRELYVRQPVYPAVALKRSIEGQVVAKLLINEHGIVEDIKILSVEGHESFRQAVLDVIDKWRFTPARHNGTNVKIWAIKRIRFKVEK